MGTGRGAVIRAAALIAAVSLATTAVAQTDPAGPNAASTQDTARQPTQATTPDEYSDGPVAAHLFGDFQGLRTEWHDAGVDVRANVIDESAGNVSGGKYEAFRTSAEANFGADLDMGKLGVVEGGLIHITFTQRWGRSLSADALGAIVSVQEIHGTGQTFRLTNLAWQQSLFDKHVDIGFGRVITENNFSVSPYQFDHASLWCVFQNNGICGTPVGVPVNAGYAAYPLSVWGGRVKLFPNDTIVAAAGAYEVNPSDSLSSNGLKLSTNGDTGAFIPAEIGWRPGHKPNGEPAEGPDAGLPGDYFVGIYYDTTHATDPFGNIPGLESSGYKPPSRKHTGKYGLWAQAAQQVTREATGTNGLNLFAALDLADAATSLIRVYAEAGAVYHGLIRARESDTVGLAVTDTEINGRRADEERRLIAEGYPVIGKQGREIAVEANYTAAVFQGFNVEPNVQYVIHPGALNERRNALVLGLRTALKF